MAHQFENRRAGGATGSEMFMFEDWNSSENKPSLQKTQAHDRVRRRYLVARLHRRGAPALYYFLAEIERGADLRKTLVTYASLPPDFIRAYCGDKFAPALFAIPEECQ